MVNRTRHLMDWVLVAAAVGLLIILADQWYVQMMPYKFYETRDFFRQLFNIG